MVRAPSTASSSWSPTPSRGAGGRVGDGAGGGEIAGLLVVAVRERVPVAALRELIYPYPTFVRGVEDALRQL
jgi:hypothetical protein